MIKLDQTYFTAAFKETVKCYIMSYNVKAGGKIDLGQVILPGFALVKR